MDIKKSLKKNFELIATAYVKLLCKKWHLDYDYGFWVGDEIGGLWCYGDNYAIDYDTIRILVDQDVSFADFIEWDEYCSWAIEYDQMTPSLKSWLLGCPRLSDATQRRLIELKAEFEKAKKQVKESLV